MNDKTQSSPIPLKAATKTTIEKNTLSDTQVNSLLDLQKDRLDKSDSRFAQAENGINTVDKDGGLLARLSHHPKRLTSLATMAIFAIALSLWVNNTPDYSYQIAQEAAKNHLTLKPLEVQTQSMDGIRGYFTQLDFSPVQSSVLNQRFLLSDQHLLGGRYCSIKGVTAAQLRYNDVLVNKKPGNQLVTLYQVPYDPEIYGDIPSDKDAPTVVNVKGLSVSLWVEKGLLMVLTSQG